MFRPRRKKKKPSIKDALRKPPREKPKEKKFKGTLPASHKRFFNIMRRF